MGLGWAGGNFNHHLSLPDSGWLRLLVKISGVPDFHQRAAVWGPIPFSLSLSFSVCCLRSPVPACSDLWLRPSWDIELKKGLLICLGQVPSPRPFDWQGLTSRLSVTKVFYRLHISPRDLYTDCGMIKHPFIVAGSLIRAFKHIILYCTKWDLLFIPPCRTLVKHILSLGL